MDTNGNWYFMASPVALVNLSSGARLLGLGGYLIGLKKSTATLLSPGETLELNIMVVNLW